MHLIADDIWDNCSPPGGPSTQLSNQLVVTHQFELAFGIIFTLTIMPIGIGRLAFRLIVSLSPVPVLSSSGIATADKSDVFQVQKHNEATTNGKDRGNCIVVTQPQKKLFFSLGWGEYNQE